MKALAVATMLLLAWAQTLWAQATAPRDPFALPTGTMACHARTAAGGLLVVDFADGEDSASVREINAVFDSAGTPHLLTVFVPERTSTSPGRTRAFGVVFQPTMRGLRGILYEDQPQGGSTPREPMNDAELAGARGLALWIWNRTSCRRTPQPPVAPPGPPKRDTTQPIWNMQMRPSLHHADALTLPRSFDITGCTGQRKAAGMLVIRLIDTEDSASVRLITGTFDSAGAVRVLQVFVPTQWSYVAVFDSLLGPSGYRIAPALSSPMFPGSAYVPVPMSDTALGRAREIARWLWSNPCGAKIRRAPPGPRLT